MHVGRLLLFIAASIEGAQGWAAPPRVAVPQTALVKDCLNSPNIEKNYFTQSAQWEIICPLPTFIERLKSADLENPGLRLLMGRLLHDQVLRVRTATLQEAVIRPMETENFENKLFSAFHDFFQSPVTLPPVPFESAEGKVVAKTQALVEAGEGVLKPLFQSVNPVAPLTPLSSEAVKEHLLLLGDSLRFSSLAEALPVEWPLVSTSVLQKEVIKNLLDWVDVFGAAPVRPWLQTRLEAMRPNEITGTKPEALTYWLRSLDLAGPPSDKAVKEDLLARLRQLWVAYPAGTDGFKIRTLSERLGISGEFTPPSSDEMKIDELLTRTQAQVHLMDGVGALRTLKRVAGLPKDEIDADGLWQSLQLNSRVLRILDQRDQIPEVLEAYNKNGRLLTPPKRRDELAKFLLRGVEITRLYWSYDTPEKAQEILNKFIAIARRSGQEAALGQFLYLKARMVEQTKDKAAEKSAFSEALRSRLPQDLMSDLMWRNLHLHFDLVRENAEPAKGLMPLFDPLKKYLSDPVDKARWHYWRAQATALTPAPPANDRKALDKLNDSIIEDFEKSYKDEPYSFYSDLSGVELTRRGHKPKDWVLAHENSYGTPDWSNYFSSNGLPKLPVYRDLARVYFLASIGDFEGASQAALEMDSPLWDRILSAKSAVKDRKKYARAVAWLRLSIQDSMGSLRVAEIARQAFGTDFEGEDFLYLYPLPYWDQIQAQSAERMSDPWLAASLIRQESAFNPKARSGANALGLMQMIPSVATAEARRVGLPNFKVQDLYDTSVAVKLGVSLLSHRVSEMDGSWICATAAYNAGVPPVQKWLNNYETASAVAFIERISFAETRNYVRAILRNYMNYRRIYADGNFELDKILKMPRRATPPANAVGAPPKPPNPDHS